MTPNDRFWQLTEKQPNGCIHWIGPGISRHAGYARIGWEIDIKPAHVVAFEIAGGTLGPGQVVDHDCHNLDLTCPGGACHHRRCVNPEHLRAVDRRTNVLAGRGPSANHARQTHCINGHEFTPENTYVRPDRIARMCRECRRQRDRQRDADRRRLERPRTLARRADVARAALAEHTPEA